MQLSEPKERVYQRANAIAFEILWVSLSLGAATCLLGDLGARQLTGRLKRLTESVASVGQNAAQSIDIPGGVDEVAQLARAFASILGDLQHERRELQTLSSELERRVAVRTREVERLAEESRYAAIVRERLKIARDLHDTLAHSMMAILSEIRFLRKLQARDPAAVADELARAEEVAHEGLKEARSAITQMRANAVRETGLGPGAVAGIRAVRQPHRRDRRVQRRYRGRALRRRARRDADAHGARGAAQRRAACHGDAGRDGAARPPTTGGLELRIEDNGVGFDPLASRPGHYGLVGLREQAELIGADLILESGPQGTAVRIWLRVGPARFVP